MALDNVETDPYYIFAEGAIPEDVDPAALSWSTSAPAKDYDWSGVAVRQTSSSTTRKSLGALITRKHIVVATHNAADGLTYTFINPSGALLTRTATIVGVVTDVTAPLGTDITVMRLDSELPDCEIYSVVTDAHDLDGYGILTLQMDRSAILRRLTEQTNETEMHHAKTAQQEVTDASGNPVFVAIEGALCLLATNWHISSSFFLGHYVSEINAILAADGSYSLTTIAAPTVEGRLTSAASLTAKPIPSIGALA